MYRRILVAVDGSATSNKALSAALEMASYSGGRSAIRLIHVIDEMAYFMALDPYAGQSYSMLSVMQEAGEKILAAGLAIVQSAGVHADTVLVDQLGARLAESVAAQVKAWDASLVVVGTHGRKGLGRVLMGSGAEQIIRMSTCPVLVVHSATPTSPSSGQS
jgi:nucleotide-binding universal stress UspA family protein